MQVVQLDSKIKLLDSPGIVFANSDEKSDDTSIALKNAVKIQALKDPFMPATAILKRISRQQIMELYNMQEFSTPDEFFAMKAARMGKYRKGGVPDMHAAARSILEDWNSGKIRFALRSTYTYIIIYTYNTTYFLMRLNFLAGITRCHLTNRYVIYPLKLSVK